MSSGGHDYHESYNRPPPMRRRTFLDLLVAGVAGYAVRPSIAVTAQPVAWHGRLPKVELHLHLEDRGDLVSADRKKRLAEDFQRDPSWHNAA